MTMNWKRGLTRVYIVLWIVWGPGVGTWAAITTKAAIDHANVEKQRPPTVSRLAELMKRSREGDEYRPRPIETLTA